MYFLAGSSSKGKHKLEGMVNVISKRYEHEGCMTIPSFNIPTEKIRRFCNAHKVEGMVSVHANGMSSSASMWTT